MNNYVYSLWSLIIIFFLSVGSVKGATNGEWLYFGTHTGSNVSLITDAPDDLLDPFLAVKSIATGEKHTVALMHDGRVVAWGENEDGQTDVPEGLSAVVSVAAGNTYSMALRSNGTVVSWGDDFNGALVVPPGLSNVKAISAGSDFALAVKMDGSVVGWGRNAGGQITVPNGLGPVSDVAAGNLHVVCLLSDGTVTAWGYNPYGETDVPVGLQGVVAVAAGHEHSVALKSDGTVVAWGRNTNGRTEVPVGLSGVSKIGAGGPSGNHNVALKSNGDLIFWQGGVSTVVSTDVEDFDYTSGRIIFLKENGLLKSFGLQNNFGNRSGQITVPTKFVGIKNMISSISHTVALKLDGTVVAWGANYLGQTDVPVGLDDVKEVAAGSGFSVALKTNGTVVCWGQNNLGQTNVPVGLDSVEMVAVGSDHTLALREDGTVVAWGGNANGQTDVPVGLINVKYIAAGGSHSIALKEDGALIAWGNNIYGQIGFPVGLAGVKSIAAGWGHSVILKSDGSVEAYGHNFYGQTDIPAGLSNVSAIYSGDLHTIARRQDGALAVWGANSLGEDKMPPWIDAAVAVSAGGRSTFVQLAEGIPELTRISFPVNNNLLPACIATTNGQTVTLVANVGVTPETTFQWYKGVAGDGAFPVAGATSQSFTTPAITEPTKYWILVTTPGGSVMSREVSVNPVPDSWTYVDAQTLQQSTNGYTTLLNGTPIFPDNLGSLSWDQSPVINQNDNEWALREFGNGSTVLESWHTENAPALKTIIKGLEPNGLYEIAGYFWTRLDETWDVAFGLNSTNPYSQFTSGVCHMGDFNTASTTPVFESVRFDSPSLKIQEGQRYLQEIILSYYQADENGEIQVLIDDFPGNSGRTWYDGVAYKQSPDFTTDRLGGGATQTNFTAGGGTNTGAVRVVIEPAGLNARWNIEPGEPDQIFGLSSGDTRASVGTGVQNIVLSEVEGYLSPLKAAIEVQAGQTTVITYTYELESLPLNKDEIWLLNRYGNLDVVSEYRWDADDDGDGKTNRQEFMADTDPNDADDHFQLDDVIFENGEFKAYLTARGERNYRLWKLVGSAWQEVAETATGSVLTGGRIELIDSETSGGVGLYRVGVEIGNE